MSRGAGIPSVAPLLSSAPLLGLLAVGTCLFAAPLSLAQSKPDAPFLRLRETTLGYHGPSDDLTNLTEIRIGWFGPTNLNDPLTGDLWWAANLAIQEANEQRSVSAGPAFSSLPFRLVPRWAVDPWGTGVSQLTRMVYDDQPLALLGSVDSASTHLAEQVVAKANLPLVSPIATDKSITLAGVSWMYSCAPGDAAIARVLTEGILAKLRDPSDNLVMLTATDHESRLTAREMVREFARHNRRPGFRFEVTPGAAGADQQLKAAAEAKPKAVVIIAGAEDSARLTRAVREQISSAAVFGSHQMGRARFRELAGGAAEDVRFPLLWAPDSSETKSARFVERFARERRHEPDYTAALTYDATCLLIEAIRHVGPNRARVREALIGLSPWTGVAGRIQLDGTGQNTRAPFGMGAIRKGAIVPLSPIGDPSQTASNHPQP